MIGQYFDIDEYNWKVYVYYEVNKNDIPFCITRLKDLTIKKNVIDECKKTILNGKYDKAFIYSYHTNTRMKLLYENELKFLNKSALIKISSISSSTNSENSASSATVSTTLPTRACAVFDTVVFNLSKKLNNLIYS